MCVSFGSERFAKLFTTSGVHFIVFSFHHLRQKLLNESSIWSFDQYSTLCNITLKSAEYDEYHYYVGTADAAATAATAVKFNFTNASSNVIFSVAVSHIVHIRNIVALHIHVKSFIESSAFHRHFSSSFHWLNNFGKCTTRMNTKKKNTKICENPKNIEFWIRLNSYHKWNFIWSFFSSFSRCVWNTFEHRKLYLHIEMVPSGWVRCMKWDIDILRH